jgi:hypothetical protein
MGQSVSIIVLELCVILLVSLCWNYVLVCQCAFARTMRQSVSILVLELCVSLPVSLCWNCFSLPVCFC